MIVKNKDSIDQWGTYVTTPDVSAAKATVRIKTKASGGKLRLLTVILDADGKTVAKQDAGAPFENEFAQDITVSNPRLWSPESPYLYQAVSRVYAGDVLTDETRTTFGIRKIEYDAEHGFRLNGETRKFKGVCLQHDLGPIGAAVNKSALHRQLRILKDHGCDAIRSSHNMPSIEQLGLCTEMGFMFLAESFDEWVKAVMASGFGAVMDVPGLNYRVHLYDEAHEKFPQGFLLGSETASTVSSRGVYKFPVVAAKGKTYDDHQCSSYDLECCTWSNLPEDDFVLQDDKPWVIGEFVWTGFDYLGEPTPYDQLWPARSSYFGICDLAGLPKDRYFFYRSRWNTEKPTLHMLPHWNWEGREGETTPVFVYTSYQSAELFVNGKSMGIQRKARGAGAIHR